jgi:hypothetical protein
MPSPYVSPSDILRGCLRPWSQTRRRAGDCDGRLATPGSRPPRPHRRKDSVGRTFSRLSFLPRHTPLAALSLQASPTRPHRATATLRAPARSVNINPEAIRRKSRAGRRAKRTTLLRMKCAVAATPDPASASLRVSVVPRHATPATQCGFVSDSLHPVCGKEERGEIGRPSHVAPARGTPRSLGYCSGPMALTFHA